MNKYEIIEDEEYEVVETDELYEDEEYEPPTRLKVCYAYFFIQGALGMFLSIAIWFLDEISFEVKLIACLIFVFYFILNIEIGKGLKKLKRWAFITALILCFLQALSVFFGTSEFSLFTIFGIVVLTLLFTVKNYFRLFG